MSSLSSAIFCLYIWKAKTHRKTIYLVTMGYRLLTFSTKNIRNTVNVFDSYKSRTFSDFKGQ